jgi:cystatin-C
MGSNKQVAIFASALAVVLTFASAGFAQMVGGYKVVAKTDAAAVAAAEFAVEAQSEKTGSEFLLEEIIKAERQVVQGSNYRLCLEVSANGSDTYYVQATVYVDLKNNRKLSKWEDSTCGETAAAAPLDKPIMVGGYGSVAKTDATVIAAAKFAIAKQSETSDSELSLGKIVKAERQVVAGMNYRICMNVNVEGDEPMSVIAIVYQDLKRNYSLSSWKAAACGS